MGLPEKNTTEGKFLFHHLKLVMLPLISRMLISRLSTEEGVKGPRTSLFVAQHPSSPTVRGVTLPQEFPVPQQ